ncbi:MAG: Ig-like domain-containing protein, partial [Fidelibacterota bacterium]
MKRIFRILGLLLILVVGQLGATVIQSGSSDLEGTTSWLYDYSSLGNGDTTFLNNTVYKATFSFDVTDNHDSYFIYLGTDNDSDGEYLDDQSDWGTYVKSGIFSGAQTISAFAYYYTLDDHNADYSKDGKKLKFFVRRRGIIDSDTDTLELSGIYEWHLAPPQSPGTPDLQTNDDKGTANNDDETNLTTLNFDVSNLIVSGSNFEVQLVDEYSYNWHWRSGNSTALTPLTITTSATMTFQYDSFTHGYWYLRVNVKNQYGSISYSGNRTVFVDTQTPNPPNILDLLTSSDSGSNSSDNITNDETPTFTVSPSSGSIYGDDVTRIYFSGTYVTLTDSIINSGCPGCTYSSYDFTVETGELTTDNVYQVYAKFADDAGNVSSASDSLTFTLDTTAPNEPDKPDLSTSDDTGFLSGDNVTNLGTNADDIDITITGLSDNDIDSVLLVMDNTDTLGRVELGVGNTSYTFTVNGLTEADHTFKALVKDNAGNQSADSQGLTVTIDTTASGRPTLDLKSSSDNGRLNNDNLTNDDTPTMTTGNLVSSDSVVFYDNGTRLEAFLVNAATMDIVLSQLSDGSHPLTTKAEDPAGNFSLVSTPVVNVRIDTEAPSQPARPNLKDASDTGHANDDEYTSDTTPEFTIGTVAAIDSIVLKIAGQEIEGVPTGSSIDLEVPIAISPDGNYSAYATKIDSAGNSTDGSSLTITIDTADPSTPGKPDLTNATDTGRENDDNKTMEMRPVFTVSNISIGDSLYLKFRDSSGDTTIYARAKADATDETLTAASDVAEGTYNVWVLANDPAGNQTEGTVLSSVEID